MYSLKLIAETSSVAFAAETFVAASAVAAAAADTAGTAVVVVVVVGAAAVAERARIRRHAFHSSRSSCCTGSRSSRSCCTTGSRSCRSCSRSCCSRATNSTEIFKSVMELFTRRFLGLEGIVLL